MMLRILAICLLGVLTCGCIIKRDISRNPPRYTDFSVGSVYQLKREVWIVNGSDAPPYLSGTIRSARRLEAGVRLQVTAIYYRSSPTFGRTTQVLGKIVGENATEPLEFTWISEQNLKTGMTWIDPEYLELVTDEQER
jgi:hypothetical protein